MSSSRRFISLFFIFSAFGFAASLIETAPSDASRRLISSSSASPGSSSSATGRKERSKPRSDIFSSRWRSGKGSASSSASASIRAASCPAASASAAMLDGGGGRVRESSASCTSFLCLARRSSFELGTSGIAQSIASFTTSRPCSRMRAKAYSPPLPTPRRSGSDVDAWQTMIVFVRMARSEMNWKIGCQAPAC